MNQDKFIKIYGAKTHNLKNIDVDIPKYKLTVICGISGSGKSSLAFDTVYIEGQRRYLESLSPYVRQFLGGFKKADVRKITNLSPSIALTQKTVASNPRSTVGTISEVYDYLRLLFARAGKPFCPNCGMLISSQTPNQISKKISELLDSAFGILILAPVISGKKGQHKGVLTQMQRGGWANVRVDGIIYSMEEALTINLDKNKKHDIEVMVDRISNPLYQSAASISLKGLSSEKQRAIRRRRKVRLKTLLKEEKGKVLDSVKKALKIGKETLICQVQHKKGYSDLTFSSRFACSKCGFSLPKIEPRLFSFNSPYGACPACQGLGKKPRVNRGLLLNPELSLAQGAVLAWSSSRFSRRAMGVSFQKQALEEFLDKHGYSYYAPFKELPPNTQDDVLYGCNDFEGIIPRLERAYLETDSKYIRQELSKYLIETTCSVCNGTRLRKEALCLKIGGKNIGQLCALSISDLIIFFEKNFDRQFTKPMKKIVLPIKKEILFRLRFLAQVGLEYLNLGREATTLSVGENQRMRLATQLGSGLSGIIYVLDEPTVGLHQRDIARLILALKRLRDLKNTVIVVEHDEQFVKEADYIIEIGPMAGERGGRKVFAGTPAQLKKTNTLTAKYFRKELKVETNFSKKAVNAKTNWLEIKKASQFNLKNIDASIPLKRLVCVAGVSGSGKSTLVVETLAKALQREIHRRHVVPGKYFRLVGSQRIHRVVVVDQSPIGKTPRSNPATYTGTLTPVRHLFAQLKESRMRGYSSSHFSFNTKAGRCEACEGRGYKKIEMYFLPDVYVECEQCKGKRYAPEILEVEYKGKSIANILEMEVDQAMNFFRDIWPVYDKLKILSDVGLGYIKLGQPATTLSGGEAQRIKIAKELSQKSRETLYVLDEPTVGLHFYDIKKLLFALRKIVQEGNTIVLIEHHPNVIKEADWIIELGPEGGDKGGRIVFKGTPEQLKTANTWTAKFL